MKKDLMNEAMNGIGDDLIRDAEDNVPAVLPKKKGGWVKWVALAAAVLLIATAVPIVVIQGQNAKKGDSARNELKNDAVMVGDDEGSPVYYEVEPGAEYKKDVYAARLDGKEAAEVYDDGPRMIEEPLDGGPDPGLSEDPGDVTPEVPGQLTAGAWDDNVHFLKWLDLFVSEGQGTTAGKFAGAYYASWGMAAVKRVAVTVKSGDAVCSNAVVTLTAADGTVFKARTNRNGVAYLFGANEGTITVATAAGEELASVAVNGEQAVTVETESAAADAESNVIELMYVVDVTGSMGDEIRYLREELGDVMRKVTAANPGSRVKLALLFYRDDDDTEKFAYADFRDVTDPADYEPMFQALRNQDAAGGGDYPEALDEAIELAISKGWSSGDSTKILFHVFDAPAHDEAPHRACLSAAVRLAAEKGVRICPVIASGADELTEFTARSEAILTGGTFCFLTNDSGIGGEHLDPGLPDAVHEHLNSLMIRLINGYHTGIFADPVPWNAE